MEVIPIQTLSQFRSMNASPNPTKDILKLQLIAPSKGLLSISIRSLNWVELDQSIKPIEKKGNSIAIDVNDLTGMYLLTMTNSMSGEQEMIGFVKK